MTRYVAFLRAINVGSHLVKMERLRALCESVPLDEVSTFIASGNVLFTSRKGRGPLEAAMERTLAAALGYEVATMIRSAGELSAVVDFVDARKLDAGVRLYVGFLKHSPAPSAVKAVRALSNDVDTLTIAGEQVYWQYRTSFSESTIVGAKLEKMLGCPATFRNINTVRRLGAKL